ncbi:MAG: choice-of-anchor tandem repeat GloVer-containing protein [Opitutaceae bacterium]
MLRLPVCCLLVLSTAALLRADRADDVRNEIVPVGHTMSPPIHYSVGTFDFSSPTGNGFTPAQVRHAYGYDQLASTGSGQTIAIVDAYGSPTIQSDLNTFCAAFGLTSTTVQVYYPQGVPPVDSGWAGETSLDVEWAHAIAPGAKIVLVIAKSSSSSDLLAAVDYAASLAGVTQVSMSWGGPEYPTESTSDFHFNVPGITFFASSGDSGAGVEYPAASPYVVGVGGTSLTLDGSNNISLETAWSGSGGGASAYETIPSYQTSWLSGTSRGVPDVSSDAAPGTGVPVYQTGVGWEEIGGTSFSSPTWAALCALANSLRSQSISTSPSIFYSLATSPSSPNYANYYHDITSGSDGTPASVGYDLVTGLGTPIANQLVLALAGGYSSQAASPAFFPPAGNYPAAQSVTIVSATPGTTIRYTTDGSTPTTTTGILYAGPILVGANSTLKAIAFETGYTTSPVSSGVYTFLPQVAAPTLSPGGGTSLHPPTVTISSTTSGATIRYTTDGSTPTETYGTIYSAPFGLGNGTTAVNVIAYKAGFLDSLLANTTYTVTPLTVLYNFTGGVDLEQTPSGTLTQGSDGNFYGTTANPVSFTGTFFKVTPAGVLTTLASFNGTTLGAPHGRLVQYSDGNFYGTTYYGGSTYVPSSSQGDGTIFKVTPGGILTTLISFTGANGANPQAGLILGNDGNFYGTTTAGGSGGDGTVFQLTPTGALTTLVNFSGANGNSPQGRLVQGNDGNFYGTTSTGGSASLGTVFRVSPSGAFTSFYSFDADINGGTPTGTLIQANDGNFYGTTLVGGSAGLGAVFKLTPAGVVTSVASFDIPYGINPYAGLVQYSDGNLYGLAFVGGSTYESPDDAGDGTAFNVSPSGLLTPEISFTGINGAFPDTTMTLSTDGNFYGETTGGGSFNRGVFFKLVPQVSGPVLTPAPGTYTSAQKVTITSATPGATIRYTTDGSLPTEVYGTIYTGPISINVTTTPSLSPQIVTPPPGFPGPVNTTYSTTINAIAYNGTLYDSGIAGGAFNLSITSPKPLTTPSGGGGGGGGFDNWFIGALAMAGLLGWRRRKN